jgi:hypothetical protein
MCETQTVLNYFLESKLVGIHKSKESLNICLNWFCPILNFKRNFQSQF